MNPGPSRLFLMRLLIRSVCLAGEYESAAKGVVHVAVYGVQVSETKWGIVSLDTQIWYIYEAVA